ncbi:VirB8/TrbF family protein [Azospirillum aestuarii]|uniref:VirB8/TrbF family protein n=1 Tax=Azospirillum aestuarii TaxID=2802052 RepID=UPI001B3BB5C6|nr:VirB8/TrbF family protein [Azospirillum aestuarii]
MFGAGSRSTESNLVAVERVWDKHDSGDGIGVVGWVARLLGILLCLSMALNITLGQALVRLTPLKEKIPYAITVAPAMDAVVEAAPLRRQTTSFAVTERAWVAQYVRIREGVVADEGLMKVRMRPTDGWVARRSTTEVYEGFRARNQKLVIQALARGAERAVKIESINLASPGLYYVDFTVRDTEKGMELGTQSLRVLLRIGYPELVELDGTIVEGEGLLPQDSDLAFGFRVIQYDLSRRS